MSVSLQSILHPFQDNDDSADNQADFVWDERGSWMLLLTSTSFVGGPFLAL